MEDIQSLINESPYDESTLHALQDHINSQSVGQTAYSFEVNKALLKYYQAFPDNVNIDLVGNSLILSLTQLPSTNYLALSYIISPKFWNNPRLAIIKSIATLLEKAQFIEFWEKYKSNTEVFDPVRGFVTSIRRFIAGSLRDTCSTISIDVFKQCLSIANNADLEVFSKELNFIELKGDQAVFITKSVKPKQIDDKFRVDEVFIFIHRHIFLLYTQLLFIF